MEEGFDYDTEFIRDERHRKLHNAGPKGRKNVLEAKIREQHIAQRQAQRIAQIGAQEESALPDFETIGCKKIKVKKFGNKEEKQRLYEQDMEECSKIKGKKRLRL